MNGHGKLIRNICIDFPGGIALNADMYMEDFQKTFKKVSQSGGTFVTAHFNRRGREEWLFAKNRDFRFLHFLEVPSALAALGMKPCGSLWGWGRKSGNLAFPEKSS